MRFRQDTQAALERGRDEIIERYLRSGDPNIVGVGIGFRVRGGRRTDEPVVTVLVEKKRPAALVSLRRLLPENVEVDGVRWGIDVVEAGPAPSVGVAQSPVAPTLAAGPISEEMRPPRQGCSISNQVAGAGTGTYGATVVDLTDNTHGLLSCNHVIGRMNAGQPGEAIIQPGFADTSARSPIATLKRLIPIDATAGTDTDAAVAQLASGIGATDLVARDLMAAIGPSHPAVGLIVAGNQAGGCYMTVMDTVLTGLNVRLLGATSGSTATKAPEVGMHLEKVGRTSAYSSSTVMSIGNTVRVDTQSSLGVVEYHDLIYAPRFCLAGDSGSVACEGGDGKTFVEVPASQCPFLANVGTYYGLDLVSENDLADQARDEFFAQSVTGNLLIQATYLNAEVVKDRVKDKTATEDELYYAQEFHQRSRDFVAEVIADPTSTATVTQAQLDDTTFIVDGLTQTLMTPEEADAAWVLNDEVLSQTLGMNRTQMIAYMNDQAVAKKVYDTIAAVPTLELHPQIPLE
ncbi:hypothetical protein AB0C74_17395 [Spirillospora sp. NPDC048832]|jgi:hypothetical protein